MGRALISLVAGGGMLEYSRSTGTAQRALTSLFFPAPSCVPTIMLQVLTLLFPLFFFFFNLFPSAGSQPHKFGAAVAGRAVPVPNRSVLFLLQRDIIFFKSHLLLG